MSERYKGHLVRFLAAWLLSGAILGTVLGWAFGIGIGLVVATGYLLAIRNSAPQKRSSMNAISNSAAFRASSRE
jgi:hypothetical protein